MFERILVPLDGSKLAEQVLPHVAELANAFGSAVTALGVCEPEESGDTNACEISIDSQVDDFRRHFGDDAAARVRRVVLVGKPDQEMVRYAEQNDIGLIVMASHGRSGLATSSLGSTVDRLIRRVRVPVIVVKAIEPSLYSGKAFLFRRILAPLDGSERAEAVLPYVKGLVEKLKSEVLLMQAVAPGKHVHTVGGLDYVRFSEDEMASLRKRAREYLEKAAAPLTGMGGLLRYETRDGDAAREILKCADETDCSLIAMSTHGHSFIERWLFGGTTYKVLQALDRSILLVPAPM